MQTTRTTVKEIPIDICCQGSEVVNAECLGTGFKVDVMTIWCS